MENSKSRTTAGLLAILLGQLGIQHFYLGNTKKGVIVLVISLLTCGIGATIFWVMGIIDGINILSGKTNTDFNGNPLV